MSFQVLEPGLASLIVDRGRPRTRSLGVAVGGAADRGSLALGNALVGNPPDAPALEIALAGPTLRAERKIGGVVFGAPFSLESARQSLEAGKTFTLQPGEELHIGGTALGVRAYLCVVGGFESPLVLGSRSSLQPIQAGATISCQASHLPSRYCPAIELAFASVVTLRVLPGLQADWFREGEFESREFRVSPASNRMGLRLQSRPLTMPDRELASEPVCPGSVQVTRDGQCIVLGVDGQTIGGYPKVAQVVQADLDLLGQLRPGQQLRFVGVTMEEATRLLRAREKHLAEWGIRLRAML
jgi:biotin-dependent carboxylase-like uncharacterized protein